MELQVLHKYVVLMRLFSYPKLIHYNVPLNVILISAFWVVYYIIPYYILANFWLNFASLLGAQ